MKARFLRNLASALVLVMAPLEVHAQAARPDAAEPTEVEAGSREILVMLNMPPAHLRPGGSYAGSYGDSAALAARVRQARRISRDSRLELVENWPMPLIGVDCFVMRVPPGQSVDEVIERLGRRRDVAWSQPLNVYHTMASSRSNDPLFAVQPAAREWQLSSLHQFATGDGVKIAVIDSQVDLAHPDLVGQIAGSRNFVSSPDGGEGHGTGVAGVIGAKRGNGIGIAGIAPGARLLALRACREGPARLRGAECSSLALAKALHFAIDKDAHVINLSLSGPQDRLLSELISIGIARKISVVAAYDPRLPGGGFPASQPGVLAVVEQDLRSAPGFVYKAPGKDIPTTRPGGTWGLVSGSSFAAAHVSGLLALARERRRHSKSAPRLFRTQDGIVDACATVSAVSPGCDCSCAPTP